MLDLERIWYKKNKLQWLLWPFSWGYQLLIVVRFYLYQLRFFKSTSFPVPVIVVGNITVGGTGKTPFCIALCQLLQQQGYKPGLVSRGYGGKAAHWPQQVTPLSDPHVVGDEPILLATRTGCPMVVGPNRVAATAQLLALYDCDIVISDDGLQHYRLARDVEIVMLRAKRSLGNGLYLPAGPLRESKKRLQQVDVIVSLGDDSSQGKIQPGLAYALQDPQQKLLPEETRALSVCALAGIADPQRFFDMLSSLGFRFIKKAFPDHYHYQRADLAQIEADIILMTEKDAVKCRAISDRRCYVLPITVTLQEDFSQELLACIDRAYFSKKQARSQAHHHA